LDRDFLTFETFLVSTAEEDRVFLGGADFPGDLEPEGRERFAAACCGMANGGGGWVVFGAEYAGRENEKDVFLVEGVEDSVRLERELRALLRDPERISANPVSAYRHIVHSPRLPQNRAAPRRAPSDETRMLLAVKVETADWFLRPVCAGADFLRETGVPGDSSDIPSCVVYRRVEGNDVVSGSDIRFRMAMDALERTRDDFPAPGLSVRDLDMESVISFRRAVLARRSLWANLSEVNFLKRVLVLDDDEKPTRAGQLLLGASPDLPGMGGPLLLRRAGEDARFASNLWSAYSEILPELLKALTEKCADAVRECFMNALLHADYDSGCVKIDMGGEGFGFIRFSNPGLPRTRGAGGARNYRLSRMFGLAGALREVNGVREKHGKSNGKRKSGLEIVRAYDEEFRLRWDTLDLSTSAELSLESVRHEAAEPEASPYGWMPVVEEGALSKDRTSAEEYAIAIETHVTETPVTEEAAAEEVLAEEILAEEVPAEEVLTEEVPLEETALAAPEEAAAELPEEPAPSDPEAADEEMVDEEEFLDEDEGEGEEGEEEEGEEEEFVPEFDSLEEMVRSTPRLQASIVREAILELCVEYKSLPELSAALARSETSLRRHYISAMVREGLLQMEHPNKPGHPGQRYKRAARRSKPKK
jgi:predicted HTH transcriptional regulator